MAIEGTPDDARELSKLMGRGNPTLHDVVKSLPADSPAWEMELRDPSGAPIQKGYVDPGELFIESAGYKQIRHSRGGQWSTGPIEVQTKGTLTSTPGTALTPPQYVPGIVETLYQPPTIADLFGSAVTSAGQVRYVSETTATNAAAPTAEAAQKPESTLGFSEVVEPVRKIATFLPISDELLEDADSLQTYISQRLNLFIRLAEEDQLLRGNGTAPNLAGLIGRSGVQSYGRGTTSYLDGIRQMITKVRGSSMLEPDAIVLHPNQWETIQTVKTTTGEYLGDPFTGGPNTLWGKPVVVSTSAGAGTVIVGAFKQGAAVYRRGGLTVEASNSHSTFFQFNLTAIRAEERLALAVYRSNAFVVGTAFTG